MDWNLILDGLYVTAFGLAGVFGALIAFYVLIILLSKIPANNGENESEA